MQRFKKIFFFSLQILSIVFMCLWIARLMGWTPQQSHFSLFHHESPIEKAWDDVSTFAFHTECFVVKTFFDITVYGPNGSEGPNGDYPFKFYVKWVLPIQNDKYFGTNYSR